MKPDIVLVHGDTTTLVTALACFYKQIAVGHVEAGRRTYNIYSPYPEEFNRQAVSVISKYNVAPTEERTGANRCAICSVLFVVLWTNRLFLIILSSFSKARKRMLQWQRQSTLMVMALLVILFPIKMGLFCYSPYKNADNLHVKQIYITPNPTIIEQRKALVEHPFGPIKRTMDAGYLLTKGKTKVTGEFSLVFLAYNIKRVINIMGVKKLIAAMI